MKARNPKNQAKLDATYEAYLSVAWVEEAQMSPDATEDDRVRFEADAAAKLNRLGYSHMGKDWETIGGELVTLMEDIERAN